jgi:hypothetical protein
MTPRGVALGLAAAALTAAVLATAACSRGPSSTDPPDAPASPQAKAVPAQLANVPPVPASGAVATNLDAGPPPVPLRGDRGVSVDVVGAKDLVGFTLQAALRASDAPPPTRSAEVSLAAIEAARKRGEPRLTVDFAGARARIALGAGFVLPSGTELRARVDRYGFLVVEPEAPVYRVAPPGSLRALLGDRRLDVAPISPADLATRGEGARRLGYRTRKVELVTRAANATFEIARVPDTGDGGTLLCRALLDLVNAPPSTPLCGWDEVPLRAELRWSKHGSLTFEASSLVRRTDLAPLALACPPPTLAFLPSPPAPSPGETWLTGAELAALHGQPLDVGDAGVDPAQGLVLLNTTDELRIAWLDGAPVGWVSPGGRVRLPTLLRGRYAVAWRTFLGDAPDPTEVTTVPGASRVGPADAGL